MAVALYLAGLSFRKARGVLRSLGYSVSHEDIRRWYLKLKSFMPSLGRRVREAVAMDEAKVKVGGLQVYIWSARDVASKEVLAAYVSHARSNL
ncbi:MAG: hypothetical protein QW158_05430, partial [Nitrososphaerales archaeon]